MTHYRLDNLSVLVVEDNSHMMKLLVQILNNFGVVDVRKATDGEAGFEEYCYSPPDLIITDWMMEPKDGLDFVKMVRGDEGSPEPMIPIIMVTAHSERYRIVEARDAGINEFLAKPVSPKAVYDRIVTIIDRPRKFIRGKEYIGPDRRRREKSWQGDERRGTATEQAEELNPKTEAA